MTCSAERFGEGRWMNRCDSRTARAMWGSSAVPFDPDQHHQGGGHDDAKDHLHQVEGAAGAERQAQADCGQGRQGDERHGVHSDERPPSQHLVGAEAAVLAEQVGGVEDNAARAASSGWRWRPG